MVLFIYLFIFWRMGGTSLCLYEELVKLIIVVMFLGSEYVGRNVALKHLDVNKHNVM